MTKLVISGYYGFDNIGDEAILQSLIDLFFEFDPNVNITVLSSDPRKTSYQFSYKIKAINRLDPFKIISEIKKSNLFISGGGGLLQDVTSFKSISYYVGLIFLAQNLNIPTMICAQGIGPINYNFNQNIVKKVLNKTNVITVRDVSSMEYLIKLGIDQEKIFVTTDPVITLKPVNNQRASELIAKTGLDPKKPTIGISIRPWKTWYERQLKSFTSVIGQLANKFNTQILIIPFQMSQDYWLCKEAFQCLNLRPADYTTKIGILDYNCTPSEIMGIISQMALVIGMRLHSLIMAAATYVPAIGISYDPKIINFAKQVGFFVIPSITSLQDSDNFANIIIDTWRQRFIIKHQLKLQIPQLYELAKDNIIIAFRYIKNLKT